jgi:hypothetical protein
MAAKGETQSINLDVVGAYELELMATQVGPGLKTVGVREFSDR